MKQTAPHWPVIIGLAVVKFIVPFVLQSPVFELQRDEFLYFEQGQHVDWGYLENPPLLSWLGLISSWVGGSVFTVKFWPALFGSLTLIVCCLITVEFGGKKFAQFLAGICMIIGAFLRVHALFQPNVLDIFFWTLAIYFIIRYVKAEQPKWLFLSFMSLSLGFLGKYSVVFIAASLMLSMLLTRQRNVFSKNGFYIAMLPALLLILPNAWWQYNHNWPLVHHMEELQETQLKYMSPGDFLKDQVLFFLPAVFVWITGLFWLFRTRPWRFLFFTYFLVIIFLMLGRGKSYYSLGVYPMLFAAGATRIENWSKNRQWARYAVVTIIMLLTLPLIPLLLPVWKPSQLAAFYKSNGIGKTGMLKWEDQQNHPLPQDFADMLGWKELAEKTENIFQLSLPDSVRANTAIFCDNYGQAGALKFYGRQKEFKSRVLSANGSFLLWIPDSVNFKHLLYVDRDLPDAGDEIFSHFSDHVVMDSVTNPLSRQYGDKITFFRNADDTAAKLVSRKLQELKKRFRR